MRSRVFMALSPLPPWSGKIVFDFNCDNGSIGGCSPPLDEYSLRIIGWRPGFTNRNFFGLCIHRRQLIFGASRLGHSHGVVRYW